VSAATPQKLAMAPTAIASFGRHLPKAMSWVSAWRKRDPSEPHVHLGPIGVEPALRGQGIGSQMLAVYCGQFDLAGCAGYLETDNPENVRLYERFGFQVRDEAVRLGVPNWVIWREPTRPAPVGGPVMLCQILPTDFGVCPAAPTFPSTPSDGR
jgi:hypothetical protein